MSETRNFMALDWVKSEIEDTLRAAREALEAFAESPDDATLARQCLTNLHQVNGTLQMVELHGAAGLASEMELLAQALMNRSVTDSDAALESLMEGILQLPSHLNRVHRGAEDDPRIHALLIDRMRVARGEERLVRPEELDVDPEAITAFMRGDGPAEVRKLRMNFQKAMLALIKKTQPHEKLYPFFDKVFTRLHAVTPDSPLGRLWALAAGVMELRTVSGEEPSAVLPLLRGLDHQLKDLSESPEATLSSRPPLLLQDGLGAIVDRGGDHDSPRLEALRRSLIPVGDYRDSGPIGADDETIATVAAALHEELGSVRDRLDLYVRGSVSDAEGLQQLGQDLQRIAGTLQVVGLDELRETIATQAAWVRQQAGSDRIDDDAIMDVAGAVLFVDSALMSLAGIESDEGEGMPGSLSDANSAVLREARASLETVKQGIVDFVSSEWDHRHLEGIPATLSMVRSVLGMIPLERAAALVEACRVYVQDEILASQTVPEWQRLDHLADALTSIDYFLERMLEDRVIPDPRMLEIAEESIAELQAGGTAAVPGADADPNETLVRPAADVAPGARPDDGPSAEFAGDDLDADDLELGEDEPAGAARDARGAPLDDGPSALSEPAEDDFDLGGDEPEAAQDAHGAPLDDGPSALSEPVEDDFDLGEDAPAVPRDARGAPLDDGPSALSEPAEDDFDLGGDEPEAVQAAHGAPLDDGPSALSKPVEDDFDMGGFELDEETPAAAPEARGAPQDDGPSLLSEPTEGDFDLGLDDDADTPAAPASSGALADDAELIDDEIIEIFLEEVTEVLEQIDASADAWRRNPRDATALTEIRRAYHTLKGSGRMVGASVLGELAWSVENMLNRVIDDTIEPSPAVVALTLQVRDIVPVLRQAFADRQVPELDVSPYMERADVLASGGSAEDLDDLPTEPAGRTPAPAATESAPRRVSSEDAPSDLSEPTEDDFDLGGVEFDLGADDDSTAAPPLPEVSAEDRDPSLLEIFDEEASEHLQTARAFVERARTRGVPPPLSDDLRRALHTLKGSAAMADFPGVSQLAAPLESLVRAYLELQLPVNDKFLDLLDAGLHRIEVGLEHLRQSGEERVYDSAEKDYLQRVGELLERLDADSRARYSGQSQGVPTAGIFSSEGIDLLLDAGAILRDWAAGAMESKRDELLAELRAVDRRAREAGQESIAELAAALAAAHEKIGPRLPATAQAPLERGHESLVGMLDALAAGLEIPAAADDIADLSSLTAADAAPAATGAEAEGAGAETESVAGLDLDPEMVEIFFEEADELLEAIEASIEGWPAGDGTAADELLRCLHTLKGGARMAGLSGLGAEAHDLETWIEHNRADAGAAFFTELRRRADVMAERIAELRRGGSIALHVSGDAGSAPAADEPVPEATRPAAEAAPAPAPAEPVAAAAPAPSLGGGDDLEDADPEILELFLEEAGELVELLDGSLAAWRREPANEIHLEGLLRALHTLKGGARMAGMMAFGEAAHDLETRLIDQRGVGEPDADFFATVQSRADALSERVAALAAGDRSAPTETIEMAPPPASDAAPEAAADAVASDAVAQDAVAHDPVARDLAEPDVVMPGTFELPDVPEPEAGAAAPPAAPAAVPASREAPPVAMDPSDAKGDGQTKEAQQEMIRVSSGLLDDLVSLAGETSIMRGRVQQEVTDFAVALDEMEATIERIQEQVRRLDNAAQEQILFRQESAKSAGDSDDFDPLEMDRYTQLQELTRTLAESASDVNDLRETLLERVRTTDTLLLQQARINTELQEGLMRTRMVPFARLLPRLKRIVRQVGRELGKPVELEVENAEGELDRNVLERMIAPLEHMLRNAVDHGLEKPEVRTERGKPAQGTIRLKLSQEGGQILIQVADDGGGINAAGVRAKAVERGLLAADAEPTQEEILAFIMSPGFSTAKSVTQISGRGVGMDVVNSEVKQLGGNISIASALGEGTSFTVRLPFTVSVSRALMVSLDGNTYAVPLTGIEGIVRVSPVQLQRRYEGGSTNFAYGGRTYELSYLGEWLGRPRQIKQDAQSVPVLMVRAGDQARAVHVDAVSGSREIVVKSLGPQFAQVAGVSGATILGDGSVVVILDLPSLLRGSSRIELTGAADAEEPRSRKRHVMVVDDSVTVRKVTTRLLERKGFEVTVAKDGVEAVAMLAEMKPDVMLLDIEMPRMDGFEVATHVRNDARLADLPIIMISSRTGDKHRERAEGIGVDRFLGKPFQEAELLSTIEDLATS